MAESLWLAVRLPPDAVHRLAHWSLKLSSRVSVEPPDGVLMEIGGSLRLFGGLKPIISEVAAHLRGLDRPSAIAAAPTPRGAWLLARAGGGRAVTRRHTLRRALAPLPCRVLHLTRQQQLSLERLHLQTLGECMTLPRSGLRRRLGTAVAAQIDQALGVTAEPRQCIDPPRSYHGRLELPTACHSGTGVRFALARLLREMAGVLQGADAAVERFTVALEHIRRDATRFTVGTLRPTRDAGQFTELAGHHLERIAPPAPICAIALSAGAFLPYQPRVGELPGMEYTASPAPAEPLWERLAARIGRGRIHGLAVHADHRPERAWRRTPLHRGGETAMAFALPPRPCWLLSQPQRLTEHSGHPQWHGELLLERGPERIETGWWDEHDVARDYYVALNTHGSRLWIFHDLRPPYHWYLHGFFA